MDKATATQITEFLKSTNLAALATISAGTGAPQSGYVYYFVDSDSRIYFATAKNSKKIENISKNSHISLVVIHESKPIEIQLEGTAQEVTDSQKKSDIMAKIALVANEHPRTEGWPPLLTLSMKSGVTCIEIQINRFKYSNFSAHSGIIEEGTGADLQTS